MKPLSYLFVLMVHAAAWTAPLDAADDNRPAVPIMRMHPQFPFELRRAGTSGTATIEFTVKIDGSVGEVAVVEATHPAFGESAAHAVSKWRFRPATRDGMPVRVRLTQVFTFDTAPTVPARGTTRVGRLEAVKKDDVVPELVSKVDPRYPPEPLQGIPRGTVTVEFWVSPEGNVSGVKILKSSHPTLRKPVLDALPQWHFAPPMRNGRPERMRLRTEIEFTLEGRPGSLDPPKKSTGAESGSSPDAR